MRGAKAEFHAERRGLDSSWGSQQVSDSSDMSTQGPVATRTWKRAWQPRGVEKSSMTATGGARTSSCAVSETSSEALTCWPQGGRRRAVLAASSLPSLFPLGAEGAPRRGGVPSARRGQVQELRWAVQKLFSRAANGQAPPRRVGLVDVAEYRRLPRLRPQDGKRAPRPCST